MQKFNILINLILNKLSQFLLMGKDKFKVNIPLEMFSPLTLYCPLHHFGEKILF